MALPGMLIKRKCAPILDDAQASIDLAARIHTAVRRDADQAAGALGRAVVAA